MTDAHSFLKSATRELHVLTDRAFEAFDLRSPNGYRDFLLAQAGALLPLEAALDNSAIGRWLPDWADRRRGHLLKHDLARLGVSGAAVRLTAVPACDWDPMGVAYVLEGSRHGARVLVRRALAGGDATVASATSFLGLPFDAGAWRLVLAALDSQPESRRAAMLAGAEMAFRMFEQSATARARQGVSVTG